MTVRQPDSDTGPGALPREVRVGDTLTVIIASQPPATPEHVRAMQRMGAPPTGVFLSTYSLGAHLKHGRRHEQTTYHHRAAAIAFMPWLEPLLVGADMGAAR